MKKIWKNVCDFFLRSLTKAQQYPLAKSHERVISKAASMAKSNESKATEAMCQMEAFLQEKYEFRFNCLTESTEFRLKRNATTWFKPVSQRVLNSFCIEARKRGIDCWDRDIARYINSVSIPEYHPFRLYMDELPVWDGVDRVLELAGRVSPDPLWLKGFHRWILALAAGWMRLDELHANSVAPILVSRRQGRQKSTFCKLLLPAELQAYYTDSFDLAAPAGCERKLSAFGLINLDEFDKFPPKKMALLKNLMQMAGLHIRKAHQNNFSNLPRIASFIGTSNEKELLTDPTGSRRFLCVEVLHKIDCSPLNHAQLYAQLKQELQSGQRYWFTSEEEAEIMAANASFYKRPVEEEVFLACFRPAAPSENALFLSAVEIFRQLKKQNAAALNGVSATHFARVLTSLGVEKIHTEYGNRYRVAKI